jgi:hypothetical protein
MVYTSNSRVLLLLHTIRSLQRVEAGDVCQCIDGATLQATNKAGLAPRSTAAWRVLRAALQAAGEPPAAGGCSGWETGQLTPGLPACLPACRWTWLSLSWAPSPRARPSRCARRSSTGCG